VRPRPCYPTQYCPSEDSAARADFRHRKKVGCSYRKLRRAENTELSIIREIKPYSPLGRLFLSVMVTERVSHAPSSGNLSIKGVMHMTELYLEFRLSLRFGEVKDKV
jgi:hypothetical protein